MGISMDLLQEAPLAPAVYIREGGNHTVPLRENVTAVFVHTSDPVHLWFYDLALSSVTLVGSAEQCKIFRRRRAGLFGPKIARVAWWSDVAPKRIEFSSRYDVQLVVSSMVFATHTESYQIHSQMIGSRVAREMVYSFSPNKLLQKPFVEPQERVFDDSSKGASGAEEVMGNRRTLLLDFFDAKARTRESFNEETRERMKTFQTEGLIEDRERASLSNEAQVISTEVFTKEDPIPVDTDVDSWQGARAHGHEQAMQNGDDRNLPVAILIHAGQACQHGGPLDDIPTAVGIPLVVVESILENIDENNDPENIDENNDPERINYDFLYPTLASVIVAPIFIYWSNITHFLSNTVHLMYNNLRDVEHPIALQVRIQHDHQDSFLTSYLEAEKKIPTAQLVAMRKQQDAFSLTRSGEKELAAKGYATDFRKEIRFPEKTAPGFYADANQAWLTDYRRAVYDTPINQEGTKGFLRASASSQTDATVAVFHNAVVSLKDGSHLLVEQATGPSDASHTHAYSANAFRQGMVWGSGLTMLSLTVGYVGMQYYGLKHPEARENNPFLEESQSFSSKVATFNDYGAIRGSYPQNNLQNKNLQPRLK